MKLLVQNTIFGDSQDFVLSDGEHVLGRPVSDPTCEWNPDIAIQTRFASERQVDLTVSEGRLLVRHAGLNATLLNDAP